MSFQRGKSLEPQLGQNQLTVIDPTASPNFEGLLSKLVSDSVGYIEIFARTAIFPGNKKTLSVNIYLSTGVVNIETQWAAQNAREARYLISTLLVPLYQYGYVNRTYLLWNDEGLVPLVLEQQPCFSNQIKDVLTLAGHPYFTTHEDDRALEKYTKDLKRAHLISEQKQ
jgi:hypothetical protein